MATNALRKFTIEDALQIKTFADRAPTRLSADGRFISYVVLGRHADALEDQVWVTDIDTGETHRLLPDSVNAWGANWSPVEPVVAFIADVGDGPQLWVYDAQTRETRLVSPQILTPLIFHFSIPQWVPDGSAVICAMPSRVGHSGYDDFGKRISRDTAPEATRTEDGASVRYWETQSVSGTQAAEERSFDPLSFRIWSNLVRVDIQTGDVTALVEDIQCDMWAVSPDGRNIAYLQITGFEDFCSVCKLCVVPTNGGKVRVLVPHVKEGYGVCFSWSPDSTMIAYCPNHEVAVLNLDGSEPRVLTSWSTGVIDEFHEAPLWSPDGTYLLATRQSSVWRIPVDGGESVNLLPDRGTLGVRGIAAPSGGPTLWSPDGDSVIVEMRDWKSSEMGLARISSSGKGVLDSAMGMQMLSDIPRYCLDVSPSRRLISFDRQSATCPHDIWVTDVELSSPRRITNLNPHLERMQFSTPHLIQWTGPDSKQHKLAYFPPVGEVKRPQPVILSVYEGIQSALLSWFGGHPVYNLQIFTNHGYGVCLPDQVFMSQEHQAAAIREMLACAVESLVAEGIADPERVGIIGHSFGGYITNVAITGLDCFAAAVSSTGFTNYTSVYGTPSPSGDESKAEFVEFAQPQMGVPPWENPQRYIENSPLFSLDKVTTPVLIVHGDKDDFISQAWELFNGLRRLNKPASLAVYQGEDHAQTTWRDANVIDFWERVLGWFDKYMGEKYERT